MSRWSPWTIRSFWYPFRAIFRPNKVRNLGTITFVGFSSISPWVRDAIYKGYYERAEGKLIAKHTSPSDCILEIGGGIGFTASLAKNANRIVLFEANKDLIPAIEQNTSANLANVDIHCSAVVSDSDLTKRLTFNIGPDFWNASFERRKDFEQVPVPTVAISKVLSMDDFSFLIVDVEGYEKELFRGLQLPGSIVKILLELHPGVIGEDQAMGVLGHLESQGFQIIESVANTVFMGRT